MPEVSKLQEQNKEFWLREKPILEDLIRQKLEQPIEERVTKAKHIVAGSDQLPPKVPRKNSFSSHDMSILSGRTQSTKEKDISEGPSISESSHFR